MKNRDTDNQCAAELRKSNAKLKRDLAKLKRVEAILKESTQEIQDLYDNAPCGYHSLDKDGLYIRVNETECRWLGYSRDELLGNMKFSDLLSPESAKTFSREFPLFRSRGSVGDLEFEMVRKDGSVFPVLLSATSVTDRHGNYIMSRSVLYDLTERKQTQKNVALLSFALDNVHEAAFLVGEQGRFLYVNQESCRLLGYTQAELLDMAVPDIDPDFPSKTWSEHWKELRERHTLTFEGRHRARDGHIYPVEIHANYFEYGGGGYSLALVQDISERRRAEQERQANLRFFESMDKINRAIQQAGDLEQMMRDVLDVTLSVLECDRAWLLYPCDPEAASFQIPMESWRPEYPGGHKGALTVPLGAQTREVFRHCLQSKGPAKFGPGCAIPVPEYLQREWHVQSQMSMAIYPASDKPWLFGLHQCSYPRVWTPDEQKLFQEIGWRISTSLSTLLIYRDLRRSEEKYRTLIQKIQAAVIVLNADGRVMTLNAAALTLLELTEEELLDKTAQETALLFYHEDQSPMTPQNLPVNEVIRTRQPIRNRIIGVRHPGGQKQSWLLSSADPVVDDHGNLTQVIVTFVDISDRKLAEARINESESALRATLNAVDETLILLTLDGLVLAVNSTAAARMKKTDTQVVGARIRDMWPPEAAALRLEAAQKASSSGTPFVFEDQWEGRYYRNIIYPVGNGRNAVVLFSQDITAYRANEIERENLLRNLSLKNRELESILFAASHSLRTPIVNLNGFTRELEISCDQLLGALEQAVSPEAMAQEITRLINSEIKPFTGFIVDNAASITSFLNGIADFCRLGMTPLSIRTINMKALAERTVESFRAQLHETGAQIHIAEMPPCRADINQIEKVLAILLDNALKYLDPARPGRIAVSGRRCDAKSVYVVEDNGIGIKPQYMQKIFEIFHRLSPETSPPGIGLGLTLALRIIEQHEGRLWVESTVGKGSRFCFELPAAENI